MKIEIEKTNDVNTVKTVDGTFSYKEVTDEVKTDGLVFDEENTKLSLEQLLQNVFTNTQSDNNLVIIVKENK